MKRFMLRLSINTEGNTEKGKKKDKGVCMGCGTCARFFPDLFAMFDGVAKPRSDLVSGSEYADYLRRAAANCERKAIMVADLDSPATEKKPRRAHVVSVHEAVGVGSQPDLAPAMAAAAG